jgi:hypothetical protein
MAKRKEMQEDVVENEVTTTEEIMQESPKLYKYEIGDEVFTMEDNKVKSFIVQKRIILTRTDSDNNIVTSVYYDDSNWSSLKATYPENVLYPSKKELLNSL